VLGSVLMIAAHPDDENTAILAYYARGRHMRTGYLSLTRGEGGQNLIGPEQGDLLGLIRSHELLAARRIDGAEQFFTRAIDFGYSKTPEETFAKWGHERILSDVVWVIRRFRPDVVILRFSGHAEGRARAAPGVGHPGQRGVFRGGRSQPFPEQLKFVEPWKARRLLFNSFSFTQEMEKEAAATPGRIEVDTGAYNPVLGVSYSQIAGMSRSMHRSQGMGASQRPGPSRITWCRWPAMRRRKTPKTLSTASIPRGSACPAARRSGASWRKRCAPSSRIIPSAPFRCC
jgi:hypothetical protein